MVVYVSAEDFIAIVSHSDKYFHVSYTFSAMSCTGPITHENIYQLQFILRIIEKILKVNWNFLFPLSWNYSNLTRTRSRFSIQTFN